jgi:hypothetical protein
VMLRIRAGRPDDPPAHCRPYCGNVLHFPAARAPHGHAPLAPRAVLVCGSKSAVRSATIHSSLPRRRLSSSGADARSSSSFWNVSRRSRPRLAPSLRHALSFPCIPLRNITECRGFRFLALRRRHTSRPSIPASEYPVGSVPAASPPRRQAPTHRYRQAAHQTVCGKHVGRIIKDSGTSSTARMVPLLFSLLLFCIWPIDR